MGQSLSPPPRTRFLQSNSTSYGFHDLPKQRHQLGTTAYTHKSCVGDTSHSIHQREDLR